MAGLIACSALLAIIKWKKAGHVTRNQCENANDSGVFSLSARKTAAKTSSAIFCGGSPTAFTPRSVTLNSHKKKRDRKSKKDKIS